MNVDSTLESNGAIIVKCKMTAPACYHIHEISPIIYQSSHKSWMRVQAAAKHLKRELNINGFFMYATSEYFHEYWNNYRGYQIWKFIFSKDQIG